MAKVEIRRNGLKLAAVSKVFERGNYGRLMINKANCAIGKSGLSISRIYWDRQRLERLDFVSHLGEGK